MKDFTFVLFKNSYLGRCLRIIVIACILVYVLGMNTLLPFISSAYIEAEASEETAGTINDSENSYAWNNSEDFIIDNAIESDLDEEDEYLNQWSDDNETEANVLHEEKELRTANEKYFRMSDGSYTLQKHSQQIHYFDNGKYEEIDNTLEKKGNSYKNKANSLLVELPISYSKNSKTKVNYGNYSLTFKLEKYYSNNASDVIIDNTTENYNVDSDNDYSYQLSNKSKAKYKFEKNQIELEQILIGTELKENIIIYEALPSYEFTFDIKAKNLYLRLQDTGEILAISEESEEVIFTIPKGYMYDALGERNDNVYYNLTSNSSSLTFSTRTSGCA